MQFLKISSPCFKMDFPWISSHANTHIRSCTFRTRFASHHFLATTYTWSFGKYIETSTTALSWSGSGSVSLRILFPTCSQIWGTCSSSAGCSQPRSKRKREACWDTLLYSRLLDLTTCAFWRCSLFLLSWWSINFMWCFARIFSLKPNK